MKHFQNIRHLLDQVFSQAFIGSHIGPAVLFDNLIPGFVTGMVYGGVCESLASELAARRNAMDAASKNAGEMIEDLSLKYNRARQGAITQELTEIVAGAEAQ